MEEIKQDNKFKKPSNKKWGKYLLYAILVVVVILLGVKLFGHKNNGPQDNQGNNQQGSIQDLMSGGAGGHPGDAGDMPPPDEGANGGPSQSGPNNSGTPPQN